MDTHGSGHFWASRDGGERHHLGVDFIAVPGDEVLSPIDGTVKRLGWAYINDDFGLIEITGRGRHEGVKVELLYLAPYVRKDQTVTAGQVVGHAQDVSKRYAYITPHVHCTIWRAVNPVDMMPRMPPPNVDA